MPDIVLIGIGPRHVRHRSCGEHNVDERRTGPGASTDDRLLREMRVERVLRPDGRYLLYYDWPDAEPTADAEDAAASPADGEPDDV
jgi:hypothetical protein